jgi:hypothetical protein
MNMNIRARSLQVTFESLWALKLHSLNSMGIIKQSLIAPTSSVPSAPISYPILAPQFCHYYVQAGEKYLKSLQYSRVNIKIKMSHLAG